MNILSVSRRTDIPAFYGDWFMNRVQDGFVQYKNPFNQKLINVEINPNNISAIVFWSKNFEPFIKHLLKLQKDYRFYFHYTITAVPKLLEHFTPSTAAAIRTFQHLSQHYSPNHVIWRFDPIILSNETPIKYYVEQFDMISEKLQGYTRRCFFSFVQSYYRKVKRQFDKLEKDYQLQFSDDYNEELNLLREIETIARKRNIQLFSCCQNRYAVSYTKKGSCIDKELLISLFPDKDFNIKKAPTRKECGCYKSIDIGAYDTCPHGCLYCYANVNQEKSKNYFLFHNREATIL